MPREQIQFPRQYEVMPLEILNATGDVVTTVKTPTYAPPAPVLHITWHPEHESGWVQVSLECDKDWLKQLIEDLDREETSTFSIFSEVLDRVEINKAVRVLRRARDAAYGKDE